MTEKYSSKENIPKNKEPNLWDLLSAPDPGSANPDKSTPSSSERKYKSRVERFKELAAMHFGTKEDTPMDNMLVASPVSFVDLYKQFMVGRGATKEDIILSIDEQAKKEYIKQYGLDKTANWEDINTRILDDLMNLFEQHGYDRKKESMGSFIGDHLDAAQEIFIDFTGKDGEPKSQAGRDNLLRSMELKYQLMDARMNTGSSYDFLSKYVDEALESKK